jgi:hypothetical protein
MKRLVLTFALAFAATGCGAGFELAVPDRFVELDRDDQEAAGYRLRATSSDGVVVAVRKIDDDVAGSLEFWSEAIVRRIEQGEGYARLAEAEYRAKSGEAGKRFDFGRDIGNRTFHYTVVVIVTDDVVWVLEAGGEESLYTARQEDVTAALASFEIR